ncbi:hypothetical protein GOEFS_042_00230 [Gordonia effusa NBRC 100432]|uniref:DUF3099 domain-containing protein n=1 Tax=Gordonia effusa NBRC 100432 TaxID=1077974 RepID=H0QYN1_9ACTN|nr:DUF3099 domain-containing protein [Gordonia effusa]GAB17932.1 hypothetical protein GOEFS_042_00230 [Gordonia effusa NBRC 100432]
MGHSGIGHRDSPETFLITGAATGLDDQHRARVRKYLTIMAIRVPALVGAGIAYNITQNGWIALAIVAVSIPLPWVAVLIANDRPPRKRGEVAHYLHADHRVADSRALGSSPVTPTPYGPAIDVDLEKHVPASDDKT